MPWFVSLMVAGQERESHILSVCLLTVVFGYIKTYTHTHTSLSYHACMLLPIGWRMWDVSLRARTYTHTLTYTHAPKPSFPLHTLEPPNAWLWNNNHTISRRKFEQDKTDGMNQSPRPYVFSTQNAQSCSCVASGHRDRGCPPSPPPLLVAEPSSLHHQRHELTLVDPGF